METPSGGPGTAVAIEDANGLVVCTYTHLNGQVAVGKLYPARRAPFCPSASIAKDASSDAFDIAYPLIIACFALYPARASRRRRCSTGKN